MRINSNSRLPELIGPCHYYQKWLEPAQATELQIMLEHEISWLSGWVKMFGKTHKIPRKQAWMSNNQAPYTYSHQRLDSQGWPNELEQLKQWLQQDLKQQFNSCLLNRYQNGQEHMGWHADDEPELGPKAHVAIISLGQDRDLLIKEKQSRKSYFSIRLEHGSLLYMPAPMQQHWLHALPKRSLRSHPGTRISLTFRMRYT